MGDYTRCPHCGGEAPSENLNCIYCGDTLPARCGVFTGLRYGGRGLAWILVSLAVLIALLAWWLWSPTRMRVVPELTYRIPPPSGAKS